MQTPINTPSNKPIPGTPLRNNWLFEPSIYELSSYHRVLNELFCIPRPLEYSLGWDVEVESAINQAKKANFTTIVIEYSPRWLDNYADMLEIVNYNEYLPEDNNDIEDIKFDLLAQTAGEYQIESAYEHKGKIFDILDMFFHFETKVRIYFI